jgi:transcriptional regulator with XRE-family HTH domain
MPPRGAPERKENLMKAENNIQLLCDANGWSLRRLAKITGIPRSYVAEIARGVRVPDKAQEAKLAHALRVPVEMLYPNPDCRRILMEK